jgi:dienelactone hydrolase
MVGKVRSISGCVATAAEAARALSILAVASATPAAADEVVQFEAARYRIGDLQQRLARERGVTVQQPASMMLTGYLSKPSTSASGPFPAVVYLHGCLGLSEYRRKAAAEEFTSLGYVLLAVDSFAMRGVKDDCLGRASDRQADAMGALLYLAKVPFVDPTRIAVVGLSQGGGAALEVATVRPAPLFDMPPGPHYRAAVAFYPPCSAAGDELAIPVLVLIGALDDWSRAVDCERLGKRRGAGVPAKVQIYPEAYHSFDNPNLRIATRAYGHWMKYDAAAAAHANAAVRAFLAAQLK